MGSDNSDVCVTFNARDVSAVTSPVEGCCVSTCLRRSTFRWKALPQISQAKGLNPVCLRLWVIRFDDWLKAFPHTRHTYGFSPVKK